MIEITLLSVLLTAPATQGPATAVQGTAEPGDPFAKPFRFRSLTKEADFKERTPFVEALSDLHDLRRLWQGASDRGFDETGRPFTKLPHFGKRRDDLVARLTRQAGMMKWILLEDRTMARRQACYFGALFLPDVQDAIHLAAFVPHEPNTGLRRAAIAWFRPFLAKQLALRSADPGGRAKRVPVYEFNPVPWLDLTRAPSGADRRSAYELLAAVARTRPEIAPELAWRMRRWMPDNLRTKNAELAAAARAFVEAVEPEARMPAEPAAAVAYWQRVMREMFPDIRMRGGVCELHPGPDRDKLVEIGERSLRRAELGKVEHVTFKSELGTQHRVGIRLGKLPPPLDELGLKQGILLTAVNGMPITGCGDLLRSIEKQLAGGAKSFFVEWIDEKKRPRARRYVVR